MASSSSPREPLVPTINFSMVCPGVYRSGYPTKKNYSFLSALRLRSVLYLCPEDYAESNLKFCEENGIHVLRFPTEGNKEPFNDVSEPLMHRILGAICDTRNLPLLIHCNKGKHRTGTVVACLRHLQGWSLVSIFEEYKRFASDKARVGDQQYVELYHPIVKLSPPFVAPWVTITPRVTLVTSDRELMEAETLQLGTSLLAPDKAAAPKKGGGGGGVKATTAATTTPSNAPSASSPSGTAASTLSNAPPQQQPQQPPLPSGHPAPAATSTTAPLLPPLQPFPSSPPPSSPAAPLTASLHSGHSSSTTPHLHGGSGGPASPVPHGGGQAAAAGGNSSSNSGHHVPSNGTETRDAMGHGTEEAPSSPAAPWRSPASLTSIQTAAAPPVETESVAPAATSAAQSEKQA